jgi:hypothetical protein
VLLGKTTIEQFHQVFGETAENVRAVGQETGVGVELATCCSKCDGFLGTVYYSVIGCVVIPAEGAALRAADSDDIVGHDYIVYGVAQFWREAEER